VVTTPPPPAYVQTFNIVRDWLVESQGFTFLVDVKPLVAKFEAMETSIGRATPRAMADLDGTIMVSRPIATHPRGAFAIAVTLHELLHQTVTGGATRGGFGDVATSDHAFAAEQATDTMTADLLPALLHERFGMSLKRARWWMGFYTADSPYRHLIVWERRWSAERCGCKWTSPKAQSVRFNWFLKNPSDRTVVKP
jgi:hypothetical protein